MKHGTFDPWQQVHFPHRQCHHYIGHTFLKSRAILLLTNLAIEDSPKKFVSLNEWIFFINNLLNWSTSVTSRLIKLPWRMAIEGKFGAGGRFDRSGVVNAINGLKRLVRTFEDIGFSIGWWNDFEKRILSFGKSILRTYRWCLSTRSDFRWSTNRYMKCSTRSITRIWICTSTIDRYGRWISSRNANFSKGRLFAFRWRWNSNLWSSWWTTWCNGN